MHRSNRLKASLPSSREYEQFLMIAVIEQADVSALRIAFTLAAIIFLFGGIFIFLQVMLFWFLPNIATVSLMTMRSKSKETPWLPTFVLPTKKSEIEGRKTHEPELVTAA